MIEYEISTVSAKPDKQITVITVYLYIWVLHDFITMQDMAI